LNHREKHCPVFVAFCAASGGKNHLIYGTVDDPGHCLYIGIAIEIPFVDAFFADGAENHVQTVRLIVSNQVKGFIIFVPCIEYDFYKCNVPWSEFSLVS